MSSKVIIILSTLTLNLSYGEFSKDFTEIVWTNSGPLRGAIKGYRTTQYLAYQGIPYAEAPVGDLRFAPPVPKEPWTDILNATKEGFVCPQIPKDYALSEMNENCLFLNVFVPSSATTDNKLPVLLYLPSGNLRGLSGNEAVYGPQLLMETDRIILVTINYRLGALGFLSLNITEASGNMALKDTLQALRWINENIEFFNGDPHKITVGGTSSGAVIANYLMLTDKSTGLFRNAILQSGNALGYRFFNSHPINTTLNLVKQLGLNPNKDFKSLLNEMRQLDAFQIVNAEEDMGKDDSRVAFRPYGPFTPSAEPPSSHAFITQTPLVIVKSGVPQNVPTMVGFAAQEGIREFNIIQANFSTIELLNEDFQRCIPSDIEYERGSEESISLANAIREFYFNSANITLYNLESYIDMITDTQFFHSTNYWVRLRTAKENSKPLYYYMFDFDGQLPWYKLQYNISWPGTCHTDDYGYLFYTNATREILPRIDSTSSIMVGYYQALWTNFVLFGLPTPEEGINVGFKWSRTQYPLMNHLQLTAKPEQRGAPLPDRALFWQNVYDHYYGFT